MSKQDETHSHDDNQKLLLGLAIGAAAGAAAVLILGPTIPAETKEKIAQKTAPLRNLLQNNLDTVLQYGISALTAYAGKSAGENSPLQTVVQVLHKLDKNGGEKDKPAKKEGKKKRKNDSKDSL